MRALTDFGDAAVLLPLSIVIVMWLLSHGSRRVAGSWVLAVGFCVTVTALLKIYMYACPPALNLVSPSGHSALSVLIYGAIALVIAAGQRGWLRCVILVIGASWVVAIAASRLWLNVHSAPEVGTGIVIGIATLALFACYYLRSQTEGRRLRPVMLSIIVVTAVLHGQELRAEDYLHAISRHLHLTDVACPG